MQLVDIGANLTHASFRDDLDQVIARAQAAGIARIVVTGTTVEESRAACELASGHPGLYATAGVHPHHARDCGPTTIDALRDILRHPQVVAVGECGLDFNRNYSPHPDQEKWFVAQVDLAVSINKPLFLHSRDAHPRFSQIVHSYKNKNIKAVAHCFTGGKDELHSYLDLGLYIGITGWVCDERRGAHLLELIKEIPKEKLLLETDAPYLTPRDMHPHPKARRNEPAFLPHIARAVAKAAGRSLEQIALETTSNARALFGLDGPSPESRTPPAEKRPLAA